MRQELASLGTTLSEPNFSAIVLGSLPKSYDQFLLAVTATASILKQELNPEDLMQTVIIVLFQPSLASKPRLWLGLRRLQLSQTLGQAKAVKLAWPWPGLA
jgi:hypothetical protein